MSNIDWTDQLYRIGSQELAYLGYSYLTKKKFSMEQAIEIGIIEGIDKLFLEKEMAKLLHSLGIHIEYQKILNYELTRLGTYLIEQYLRYRTFPDMTKTLTYMAITNIGDFGIYPLILKMTGTESTAPHIQGTTMGNSGNGTNNGMTVPNNNEGVVSVKQVNSKYERNIPAY